MVDSLLAIVVFILFPLLAIFTWRSLQFLERNKNADWGSRGLNYLSGLNRWFCTRYHRLNGIQIALPRSGCAILASNHVSGLDPMVLVAASNRPLRFLIAKEQYERLGLTWLFRDIKCIPVDRKARPERAFREALRALEQGEVVALFPHGKIHLDSDPPRALKAGVVKLAQLSGCPIYPVRIDGVKGEGQIVRAVFRRSKVRLRASAPLHYHPSQAKQCLAQIARHIESAGENPSSA
jgi:1-acyl-sn-glycerol-3-phosphate acyltransferase